MVKSNFRVKMLASKRGSPWDLVSYIKERLHLKTNYVLRNKEHTELRSPSRDDLIRPIRLKLKKKLDTCSNEL